MNILESQIESLDYTWRASGNPSRLLCEDCYRNCAWVFQTILHRAHIWPCHFPDSFSWLPVAIKSLPPSCQAKYVLACYVFWSLHSALKLLQPDRTDCLLSPLLCLYHFLCLENSPGLWPHGKLLFILQDSVWTLLLWRLPTSPTSGCHPAFTYQSMVTCIIQT